MYDFEFGASKEIEERQEDWLLFIKRLLPRWCNSIPDNEYIALHNTLNLISNEKPLIAETGCGASTLALVNTAIRYGGHVMSWDINPSKGSFLRGVITETLVRYYNINLWDYWTFVPFSSLSPYLGLAIIAEMKKGVDAIFIDGEHTLDTIMSELIAVDSQLNENSIVILDDANYTFKHVNMAYINMQRQKLNLPPADAPVDNVCRPFYVEVQEYLEQKWNDVTHLEDTYKQNYKDDLFWTWYSSDRSMMSRAGMEKVDNLQHRYESWRLGKRKS